MALTLLGLGACDVQYPDGPDGEGIAYKEVKKQKDPQKVRAEEYHWKCTTETDEGDYSFAMEATVSSVTTYPGHAGDLFFRKLSLGSHGPGPFQIQEISIYGKKLAYHAPGNEFAKDWYYPDDDLHVDVNEWVPLSNSAMVVEVLVGGKSGIPGAACERRAQLRLEAAN